MTLTITLKNMINAFTDAIILGFDFIKFNLGVTLGWMIANFISVRIYHHYCVQESIIGFILSPVRMVMPHCSASVWIMTSSSTYMNNGMLILVAWVIRRTFLSCSTAQVRR